MRTDLPPNMQASLHSLTPPAIVTLFKITLADNTVFNLSPSKEVVWRGVRYEQIACTMTEISRDSDGKLTRPKFSFANPERMFSRFIYEGVMDNAEVKRFRILSTDLDADLDFAVTELFRVSRIMNLSKDSATVELRDILDGTNFFLPARAYYPPEFPHVSLS